MPPSWYRESVRNRPRAGPLRRPLGDGSSRQDRRATKSRSTHGTSFSVFAARLQSRAVARDISIRLAEDRPGALGSVVQALSEAGVNIEGLAEIEGIVHVLARNPGAARQALRTGGFTIESELEVLQIPMPDRPGELSMILQRLAEAGVSVRFMYLLTDTRVAIGTDDITTARNALGPGSN